MMAGPPRLEPVKLVEPGRARIRRGYGFHLEPASFDEFVLRNRDGHAHFHGQCPTKGRHRDRVGPALSRDKRVRKKSRWLSPQHTRVFRAIDRAARLLVLRRWDPYNPLLARHITVCDHAQRPPRYDPS
jgi:hypothetical protein